MGQCKQHGVQFFVDSKDWVVPKNITLGAPVNLEPINIIRRMKTQTHKIKKYELFLFLKDRQLVKFQGQINCNIVYTDLNSTYSNINISWEGFIKNKEQVVGVLIYDHTGRVFVNTPVTKKINHTVGVVFRIRYQIEFNERVYNATA